MEKAEAIALFKDYCALTENIEKRKRAWEYQGNRLVWDITGDKYGFRINNVSGSAKMYVFVHWTMTNEPKTSTIDLSQEEFNELVTIYAGDFNSTLKNNEGSC